MLVAVGLLFHRLLSGHPYPHPQASAPATQDPLPSERVGVRDEDLDAVLAGIARQLLLDSGVRLPSVLDDGKRSVGGVGLRELARSGEVMTPPLTITPAESAMLLISALTDGHRHAAMVVDPASGKLLGHAALAPH